MIYQSRILIVDDDPSVARAMSLTFERGGFSEVAFSLSAEEALHLLELDATDSGPPRFDVILLDIMMPGIDGIEACARIRSTRRYRDVPILMCTGMNDVEALNQAFIAGANDFLTKPATSLELLARARSGLRLKRELDRRRAREDQLREENRRAAGDDTAFMDKNLGIPSRSAFEMTIRLAVGHDGEHGLLALRIPEVELLRREYGASVLEDVIRRVGITLARLEAPLGWMMFSHGDGLFFLIAPRTPTERLAMFGDAARRAVAEVPLDDLDPEGMRPIELRIAAGQGRGTDLLTLPAQLIRAIYADGAIEVAPTGNEEQAA